MINILIRTSGRPVMFARCMASIASQREVEGRIRVIVSTDDKQSYKYADIYKTLYAKRIPVTVVKVEKQLKTEIHTAPWNLYLNSLIKEVKEGWIFILDDDDELAHVNVLKTLLREADNEMKLILCRMTWPNGRVIPEDMYFGKDPERKHIGMPCFMFHSVHKHHVRFDGMRAGDYRMAIQLFGLLKHRVLIRKPVVRVGNTGLNGSKGE